MVRSTGSSLRGWSGEWLSWSTSMIEEAGVDMLRWLRGWSGWRSFVISWGFYVSGDLGVGFSGDTCLQELGCALVLLVPMSCRCLDNLSNGLGIGERVFVCENGD